MGWERKHQEAEINTLRQRWDARNREMADIDSQIYELQERKNDLIKNQNLKELSDELGGKS